MQHKKHRMARFRDDRQQEKNRQRHGVFRLLAVPTVRLCPAVFVRACPVYEMNHTLDGEIADISETTIYGSCILHKPQHIVLSLEKSPKKNVQKRYKNVTKCKKMMKKSEKNDRKVAITVSNYRDKLRIKPVSYITDTRFPLVMFPPCPSRRRWP